MTVRILHKLPRALWFMPTTRRRLAGLVEQSGFSVERFHEAYPERKDRDSVESLLPLLARSSFRCATTIEPTGLEALSRARTWDSSGRAHIAACLVNAHIATHRDCVREPGFWSQILPTLRRIGRPYLLVGDSHSEILRIAGSDWRRPVLPIHLPCLAGSAIGLANPRSRSGYGALLAGLCHALRRSGAAASLPIFLQFGQVDVEFVSNYRRIGSGRIAFDRGAFDDFCRDAILNYEKCIVQNFTELGPVHILSIFPPALSDAALAEGYDNDHVRSLEGGVGRQFDVERAPTIEIPSQETRTLLHRSFNRALEDLCTRRNLTYLDVFEPILEGRAVVDERYVARSGGRDHHLDLVPAQARLCPLVRKSVKAAYAARLRSRA